MRDTEELVRTIIHLKRDKALLLQTLSWYASSTNVRDGIHGQWEDVPDHPNRKSWVTDLGERARSIMSLFA